MSKLHTHANREAVKGVHQADSEGQIAYLNRAEVFCQRQVNVIWCVGACNMGHRFGPRGNAGLPISFTNLTPEAMAKQAVEKRVRAIA